MSGGVFRSAREDRNEVGRSALGSMTRPEFMGVGAVYAPLNYLPIALRLVVLAGLLVVAMYGCSVAWVDQQDYQPSLNICQLDANTRIAQAEPCPVKGRP
ncbi:hypothetical protein [Nocardia canadensis]|uniref:hypothetical protein n=1 Tax=Nocardia canadensis TaxID=3065238 RepID=UPI00292F0BDB|nr:hypothetical protein [Nocardia canadensis]